MISAAATHTHTGKPISGYGATTIDVGAPGDNVYTTEIGGGYTSTSGSERMKLV